MQYSCRSEDVLVSFCIAAYKRTNITLELIRELLSTDKKNIEVVVCDDRSEDGSIDAYRRLDDHRLKVFENKSNLGGHLNICEALDHGSGKYLFYLNDRDNFDVFKINKFISILTELDKIGVTFGKCDSSVDCIDDFRMLEKGEESILELGCKIDHPSGFFFRKNEWVNTERRRFFESQDYGDYAFTIVCALMARNNRGAIIHGDLCDIKRHRIDFMKEKSNFNKKRRDKSLWYSPEAQFRELTVLLMFMHEYGYDSDTIEKCFTRRYEEYLTRVTIGFKSELKNDANTVHYGVRRPRTNMEVNWNCLINGFCLKKQVKKLLQYQYPEYFECFCRVNKENRYQLYKYIKNEILDSMSGCNFKWKRHHDDKGLSKWHRNYHWNV